MFTGQDSTRVRPDRFGRPTLLKSATAKVNKKTSEVMPIFVTYIEIGNCSYKVQISNKTKESKDGRPQKWVSVTKMPKMLGQGQQNFGRSY